MGSGTGPVLSEAEVQDMRALEPSRRNRLLLRLLYSTGLRPSELCALCWRDVQEGADTGQLIIVGKRGQLRLVLLRTPVWEELQGLCLKSLLVARLLGQGRILPQKSPLAAGTETA
jgi:integrase